MSFSISDSGSWVINRLGRFLPEPAHSLAGNIGKMLGMVSPETSATLNGMVENQYTPIIVEQMRQQMQLQLVSLVSNTEKSKHETAMVPLRNVRVA